MGIYDYTIYDVIIRNALIFKNKTAWMEFEDQRTQTFVQIKKEVDCVATALRKAGLVKGDRVGVIGKNCLEYFLIFSAAAALGAIVVPINWRLSADEAAYNLNDTQPRMVFLEGDTQDWLEAVRVKLPPETLLYNLQPGKGSFPDLDVTRPVQTSFTPEDVRTDDGLVIIHTAAVDGRPRGALLSHGNLLSAIMHLLYGFGLSEKDTHLSILPMFHVAGIFLVFLSFHAGAKNINMRKFDAHSAVRAIAEHRVSLMFDFAPILTSVLDAQAETKADLTSLRAIMGLDTPDAIERYQNLAGGTFFCLYGQTETSMIATMQAYNECPGSAGRPLPLVTLALLDDMDNPVSQGQVGEIAVKGPMVFKGYWGLEKETAAAFKKDCHHTGDLGRLDENGFLWYAGRKPEKELIKPGGENVYPAEVEKVILEHPSVETVVVFGVPDPKWKEGIKAVCTLKPGQKLSERELIDFVGSRIARYKKPQHVEFVKTMPKNAAGIIDRVKVKALYGK